MQSLILVLLSIGAASAAPQQFFVLPDFLASAQTHSGLSHQELVPVVIPIGDHSKLKSEPSSTDFDVFMKVPESTKESSTLIEDVPSKIEGDVSQVQHSDSPNPVELLLNEMQIPQIVQTEESLTDSETDQIPTEIQQSAVPKDVPEKLSPTHDEGSQATLEKVKEVESQLEKEEQIAEAAVPSLIDLELKTAEPKEDVAVEEVLDTIEKDASLKPVESQEPIIQKQATVELDDIKQEPTIKVDEQQHVTETIIDDKDITAKQEALEVAEIIPQDAVKHEEISQDQEVKEIIKEKTSTKPEDKIHATNSISTGKTLFQDTKETTTAEEHTNSHAVEEEPKLVDTQTVADHEEESTQSTMLSADETLETELTTENAEEATTEAISEQDHLTEGQTVTAQDQTLINEELVQTEEIDEIKANEAEIQTENLESDIQVVHSEDVTQTVEAQLTEEAPIQPEQPEIPVQVVHSEDAAQQQPTEIKSAHSEDALEAQITEEAPIQKEQPEASVQAAHSEDVSQQQLTEIHVPLSENAAEAHLTEESSHQTEQPEASVQVAHSEDVSQQQPTEIHVPLSENAAEAHLTEESSLQAELPEVSVQVTYSEDVYKQQPTDIHVPLSEDANEVQLTEESSHQTEQPEVFVKVSHSEEVAQQQPTEIHSSQSEDIVEAQLSKETPIQTEQPEVDAKLTKEAATQTEQQEVSVQVPLSEDVALPHPTEAKSEETVQAIPELTKEVPATPSEAVFEIQPTLPEVQVKEEIADSNPTAESSPSSSDITLSQANNFEENQIADSKISKTKSPAKSNLIPSNGKSITSAHTTGFRMESVGSAVQNHFGFSSHFVKMPEPTQYLHNGAFVDPRTLVEPKYRPFFYHNDSPDIVRAKVLFFQHQGNISPKV